MLEGDSLVKTIKRVLEEDENVLVAYVFGSRMRGFTTPLSDVDVAVLLKDNSLKRLSGLWSKLAKALGTNEDLVDLVDLSRASAHVKHNVVKYGLRLVDRGGYGEELTTKLVNDYPEAAYLLSSTYRDAVETLNCRIDKKLVKSRIAEILERVATLREEILSRSKGQVVVSRLYRSSMERCIHVAIESMLDICRHIVSAKKLGLPETYRDLVKLLADNNMLPHDLEVQMEEYIGLRNILVHRYVYVDHGKLYEGAEAFMDVVKSFIRTIEEIVKKER